MLHLIEKLAWLALWASIALSLISAVATPLLYVALAYGRRILDEGKELTKFWRAMFSIGLVCGVFLDFWFNTVWGTLVFLELPKWLGRRELLFSARVQRHVLDSWRIAGDRIVRTWRGSLAYWWALQMNVWNAHIEL